MIDERLSRRAIRRLNRDLLPQGLRVCSTHQGHPLPLTEEYFYHHNTCLGGFASDCKACHNAACAARSKARYHSDPEFRARKKAAQQRDRDKHHDARLPVLANAQQRYRQRQKAAGFARVLRKVTP